MADRPVLPALNAAARAALAEHDAGRISPQVALMRLVLSGVPAAGLPALLRDTPTLSALAARHAAGLAGLERLVQAGADHAVPAGVAEIGALFDRLAVIAPEAAVAAYSLCDPATLRAATAELVAWLRCEGVLEGRPRVLDLGCGIGRVAAAIAGEAETVVGLDLASAMVAAARARHGDMGGLRFATCNGRDLAGLDDAGFHLVLAVDVFPYLVQAGADIAGGMVAEAARVLRPGGHLVILNFSYGDPAADAQTLGVLAAGCGLVLQDASTRPFALWDAAAFRLRRAGLAGAAGL
ncbi:class I SAM-dependent methyltransferase [Falsiroseomonas oryzae]|uniref:class I SAM-dependent methyltransferase n=1 Tax=Falsiroseomonas oryzae TaxID=2766473 RepID=UPI0022EAB13A|nr:class I SAM-dependent methyltransferase [Roseomonas sp. MO-31]